MSTIEVQPPYPAFAGADGQPLENGYIWIGVVNLSPQTNPINVYWDAAQTIAAPQPIRTLNGYPSRNGTPARFYVASDYSIQVLDSKGSVVYTSLNSNDIGIGNLAINAIGNGTQTVFPLTYLPNSIYISGVYQNQNTYTVSGGNVTFSQAPLFNSVIEFLI